jgi:rubrerythrin
LDRSAETRRQLIDLLQLAYSGEKAAALAYRGHARSVRDSQEREAIEKIERDEWVHREKVGRLLQRLGAGPRLVREIRSSLVGHILGLLCHVSGWFLPMFFAGRLETKNVTEYDRAAAWAAELGLMDFLPDLTEMAAVEVEHEAFFFGVLGRAVPERNPAK